VGSPDSVHYIESTGMPQHTIWMASPGWKHCFSNSVSVWWKWGWKM